MADKVGSVVEMLKGMELPEPPTLVCEFPVLNKLDTSGDLEKAGKEALLRHRFGLELMRLSSVIKLRVGDTEVVLKDRYGDQEGSDSTKR